MAFKQIGTLASAVLREAELAAAAHKTQRKGGSEPSTRGEGRPDPLPIAQASGRAEASNSGMGKTRGTDGDPATRVWEECQQSGETARTLDILTYGQHMPPALPASRSIVTVSDTKPHRESARSAVIIDLVVWREVHGFITSSKSVSAKPKNRPNAKTMIQSF